MSVLRIVPDFSADDPQKQGAFYQQLFGLEVAMDMGFIVTLVSDATINPQLSLMSQGGSGTPVPAVSIEVDDVLETHRVAESMGADIVYPLTDEPWGVKRFFVKDPGGRTLNVVQHLS